MGSSFIRRKREEHVGKSPSLDFFLNIVELVWVFFDDLFPVTLGDMQKKIKIKSYQQIFINQQKQAGRLSGGFMNLQYASSDGHWSHRAD